MQSRCMRTTILVHSASMCMCSLFYTTSARNTCRLWLSMRTFSLGNYPELQITFRDLENCPCRTVGQAYFIRCLNYLHWAHLENGPAWDPLQLIEWMKKGHYMKILSQARSIDSLSRSLHSGILLIRSSREPENKAYHPKIVSSNVWSNQIVLSGEKKKKKRIMQNRIEIPL